MPFLTHRHFIVVAAVLAAHAGLLWLLQAGLKSRPAQEVLIPAEILAEWIAPTPPAPSPPLVIPPPPAPRAAPVTPRPPTPPSKPAPTPEATPGPHPVAEPVTPVAVPISSVPPVEPQRPAVPANPAATAPTSTPAVASTSPITSAPPSPPPTPRIELPSTAASYLNNPAPRYPALSRRLGEQGKVVLRVRIEVDGTASQAEVRTSSGFSRLDQTAVQTVLTWRYVPGTRNGVPEAMWFNIPINFVLE